MDNLKRPVVNRNFASQRRHGVAASGNFSTDRRIRAFIDGESHGEDVLRALYRDVADEPLPERLRAVFRR